MGDKNMKLGFVGFGAMPKRMAARLRDAGFQATVFDPYLKPDAIEGFKSVDSAPDLAREVEAILVAVPNDAALAKSMTGPGGALEGAREGQLLLNFSTVSPSASKRLAEAAAAQGVRYVETPMSGSTPEAESGKLVFLAGGRPEDIDAAKPILEVIGRRTVRIGEAGDGAVAKLIVNGIMATGTNALAEGLAYAARAGVDRDTLIDVLSDLILVSEHHKRKLAMARANDFPPQFPTRLMSKDMGLLLDDTRERGVSVPGMAAVAQLYAHAARVRPDDDYASAIAVAEELANDN
ncbi:NAD(P)-dependent oxidoreductase [Sphingomonas morindae]|uniref:NAD(P)-dependent oxidoreductase n=1 Tax=Sphingomonas morindae TaxID=1541170 RepID=A0ABY4XB53_9SPHN|nr:NAD(P)-dependent oxidoreductase [Sphingomonas morindae]USI73916.1 NAD(P)-dependent oxidoreductase [Sphingomonas morindae]